ncbi:hypothetical protein AB0E88_09635 [Streptomyces sp. NPDC028635]|uniref:hypothetical protein n=1 Tax=Streptomyces sp. NPDC028635 TaxID=3154800 RepID=UPI0033CAEE7A
MHRTTTTATLLVTVAVWALCGCVTVQRPPASGPPVPSVRSASPSVPRPDGDAEQRVVQAPAREALEMVGPSRRPQPVKPPRPHHPAHTAPPAPTRPQHRHQQSRHHTSPPEHRRPQARRGKVPAIPDVARRDGGVCALGEQYGGWRPDSPQARICKQTYGR